MEVDNIIQTESLSMEQQSMDQDAQIVEDDDSICLLIVSSQSNSAEDVKYLLNQINSSLNQIGKPLISHKEEMINALKAQLFDQANFDQQYAVSYSNDSNFEFDLLINTTQSQFKESLRQFFNSKQKLKIFINATFDYNLNGDLNLQDGLFTCDDFSFLINEQSDELKKLIKNATPATATTSKFQFLFNAKMTDLNKHWKLFEKQHPNISLTSIQSSLGSPSNEYTEFAQLVERYFNQETIAELMETSKCTGTLKTSKPCLYVFPASQGDSAFFAINGYTMLINGGFDRLRPCFWNFVNMLQQIDSVLITHTDSDSLGGLSSFFHKKIAEPDTKPEILTILGNLVGSVKHQHQQHQNGNDHLQSSPNKSSSLAASLIAGEVSAIQIQKASNTQSDTDLILEAIDKLKIKLIPLVKQNEGLLPSSSLNSKSGASVSLSKYERVNLYFKLGHGSLDLYILSPFVNSPEFKEFCSQSSSHFAKHSNQKSHLAVNQIYRNLPLSHLASAIVLLVWMPSYNSRSQDDNKALRFLFTGNAPQNVLFHALDKLKDFELLTQPVYRVKSTEPVQASSSVNNMIKKTQVASSVKENGQNGAGSKISSLGGNSKINGNHNDSLASQEAKSIGKPTNGAAASAQSTSNAASSRAQSSHMSSKPPKAVSSATNAQVKEPTAAAKKQGNLHETSFSKKKTTTATTSRDKDTEDKNENDAEKNEKPEKVEKKISRSSVSSTLTTTTTSTKKETTEKTGSTVRSSISETNTASTTTRSAKTDSKPLGKQAVKPVAAKPSSAPLAKETSAKKPLSSKSSLNTSISNKKDLKATKTLSLSIDQAGSTTSAASNIATVALTTEPQVTETIIQEIPESNADSTPVVTPKEEVKVEAEVPQVNSEQTEQDAEPKEPEVVEQIERIEHVEHVEQVIQMEQVEQHEQVNNHDEAVGEEDEEMEEGELVVDVVEEERQSSPVELENHVDNNAQNENCEDNLGQDDQEILAGNVDAPSYANESPNLSPVKKDFLASVNGAQSVVEDDLGVPVSEEQIVISEDAVNQNGTIDTNNELEILSGNINGENLVENGDLKTNENEIVDGNYLNANDDVMTRSFIEDSAYPQSNPFSDHQSAQQVNQIKHQVLNESCDLNRTHELFEGEESNAQESNIEENLVLNKTSDECADTEALTNGFGSLQLDNTGDNNNHNNHQNGHEHHEPNQWHLLGLPAPINPTDVGQSSSLTQASSLVEKKSTPNGKKTVQPTSPSGNQGGENGLKSLNKNQATSHAAKPVRTMGVHPTYVELSYIPAHGNGNYCDAEFFKRVRARNYVLSALEPNESILNALIEAKETWEDKSLQVSLIPTYESDLMKKWFVSNEEKLVRLKIDVLPAAKYATITMDENPDLSCHVYKLEF